MRCLGQREHSLRPWRLPGVARRGDGCKQLLQPGRWRRSLRRRMAPQRLDDGLQEAADLGVAATEQHRGPLGVGPAGGLGDEGGLADSRRAGDEHRREPPAGGGTRSLDGVQLVLASDQAGRGLDRQRRRQRRRFLVHRAPAGCRLSASGRGLGGQVDDGSHEPVAAAVDRLDEGLALAVVPDGAANGLDPARERRLAHEAVAPDGVEQLFLADRAVVMADEVAEDVEDLGLERHRHAGAAQLERLLVELVFPEPPGHYGPARTPSRRATPRSCPVQPDHLHIASAHRSREIHAVSKPAPSPRRRGSGCCGHDHTYPVPTSRPTRTPLGRRSAPAGACPPRRRPPAPGRDGTACRSPAAAGRSGRHQGWHDRP